MRVLLYCLSSRSGGAVAYLRQLVPRLSRLFTSSNGKADLILLAHNDQRAILSDPLDCQTIWVDGVWPSGYWRVAWEYRHLARIAKENAVDVLFNPFQIGPHFAHMHNVMMFQNMEPFLCSNYQYSLNSWLRNKVLRYASITALRRSDRIIAISEYVSDYLKANIGIPEERIRTIYFGRSDAFSSNGYTSHDNEMLRNLGVGSNFILTCGGMYPYRRCEDVIAAFNRCGDDIGNGAQLVIAGVGTDVRYQRTITTAIESSPFKERILRLGQVPWATMAVLYRHCQACVLATEVEACPNIAIEALASGCVIISSDRPPLPEIFQGCSLQYTARNIEQLVNHIRVVFKDNQLRVSMKRKSLERVKAFSWDVCAKGTYSALLDW